MIILSQAVIAALRAYQKLISPLLPRSCRFFPSCSQYAEQAIRTYGPFGGSVRAVKRVARCHPWHAGGHDPVK